MSGLAHGCYYICVLETSFSHRGQSFAKSLVKDQISYTSGTILLEGSDSQGQLHSRLARMRWNNVQRVACSLERAVRGSADHGWPSTFITPHQEQAYLAKVHS